MKFESDANRLLRYARELKQIYRDRRIAQDELKCPTQEERGTPIEQIKVFMDKYKVTKYSLAKTMGLSDSDKKKLYRYFKGKTKCLPSGGINRIAAALTELCGQKISFSD